jgi:hypothetical protein
MEGFNGMDAWLASRYVWPIRQGDGGKVIRGIEREQSAM